jgi:K+-sensing histidine kinase KdpD
VDFELRRLVEESVAPLGVEARRRGIGVICSVDPKAPRILHADSQRIRQVLINLAANAAKFTREGSVAVSVMYVARAEGAALEFTVCDTGVGIPLEKQHLIFQPFSQADGSTTRQFGGTGLGLAICVRLVELLGGRIWFESRPGEGSTFCFTAPVEPARGEVVEARQDGRAGLIQGLRILVAEDNVVNQKVTLGMLANEMCDVKIAINGRQAVEELACGEFDLVLISVR